MEGVTANSQMNMIRLLRLIDNDPSILVLSTITRSLVLEFINQHSVLLAGRCVKSSSGHYLLLANCQFLYVESLIVKHKQQFFETIGYRREVLPKVQ